MYTRNILLIHLAALARVVSLCVLHDDIKIVVPLERKGYEESNPEAKVCMEKPVNNPTISELKKISD